MTLPSTGPITLNQIKAEVGQPTLISCSNAAFGGPPHSMFRFRGWAAGFGFAAVHSSHTQSWDLRTWLLANGWNGAQQVYGSIVVNPGVWLTDSGAGYGLRIAGLPIGSVVDLVVYGYVAGKGGAGGRGGDFNADNAGSGGAGTTALLARSAVRLWDKAGGNILGGGGGGGGGGGVNTVWNGAVYAFGAGGGGSGQSGHPIVIGGGAGGAGSISVANNGSPGGSGSAAGPGAGGASGGGPVKTAGIGGAGGAWGQPGARGENGHDGGGVIFSFKAPGRPGGPPGPAVDGWAFVQHMEHSGTIAGLLI